MKKPITPKVRQAIQKATEVVLEETKEIDIQMIVEILETEYKIKFVNMEVLQKLIKESLEEIVFIYC